MTISLFCTIVTDSVLLCYVAIGHFRWVRWDPKWPWAPWQWLEMTFQAFRGFSSFARNVYFLLTSWISSVIPRDMIWSVLGHFVTPFSPRKSGFFQRKGRKRVKEWREVTFMKEWVKALYIGYHQELDLPKNLFPFPRTVQLKISLGPIRFLYSRFHGLLKLIFHTNQYNGA